ncbi:MAG: DsrE family protein [Nitrospira sp.]|nr:DsrE family protein [Nitrospira sp.]
MWKSSIVLTGLFGVLLLFHAMPLHSLGEQIPVDQTHRVVMHLNSGDEKVQRGALNNIRHLYQEVGREHLQLELVVHGAGLTLLAKGATAFRQDLADLKAEYGVRYTACSNTMKAMKLVREDLIPEVGDTVPAMVRLMERQEQGWAYIKP